METVVCEALQECYTPDLVLALEVLDLYLTCPSEKLASQFSTTEAMVFQ